MSAPQFAGAFLIFFAVGLFIPGIVQRRRARRRLRASLLADLRADLTRVTGQRDRYADLYHGAVRTNAALLEHIGDERQAAAAQAMTESPAYYDAVAARMAKTIDREWFDMAADEGGVV